MPILCPHGSDRSHVSGTYTHSFFLPPLAPPTAPTLIHSSFPHWAPTRGAAAVAKQSHGPPASGWGAAAAAKQLRRPPASRPLVAPDEPGGDKAFGPVELRQDGMRPPRGVGAAAAAAPSNADKEPSSSSAKETTTTARAPGIADSVDKVSFNSCSSLPVKG
ncbi:unnamed protein product [Urochloa humidicola]